MKAWLRDLKRNRSFSRVFCYLAAAIIVVNSCFLSVQAKGSKKLTAKVRKKYDTVLEISFSDAVVGAEDVDNYTVLFTPAEGEDKSEKSLNIKGIEVSQEGDEPEDEETTEEASGDGTATEEQVTTGTTTQAATQGATRASVNNGRTTEKTTEKKKDKKTTEKTTEKKKDKKTTEKPTEKPTEAEKTTEKPTEAEKTTEKPTESEKPTEKPAESETAPSEAKNNNSVITNFLCEITAMQQVSAAEAIDSEDDSEYPNGILKVELEFDEDLEKGTYTIKFSDIHKVDDPEITPEKVVQDLDGEISEEVQDEEENTPNNNILILVLVVIIVILVIVVIVVLLRKKKDGVKQGPGAPAPRSVPRGTGAAPNSSPAGAARPAGAVGPTGGAGAGGRPAAAKALFVRITINTEGKGQKEISHEIKSGVIVGRADMSDIVIEDAMMSRQHFVLSEEGDGLYIQDLQTTNGTEVNGMVLKGKRRLELTDVIKAGSSEIRIRW